MTRWRGLKDENGEEEDDDSTVVIVAIVCGGLLLLCIGICICQAIMEAKQQKRLEEEEEENEERDFEEFEKSMQKYAEERGMQGDGSMNYSDFSVQKNDYGPGGQTMEMSVLNNQSAMMDLMENT